MHNKTILIFHPFLAPYRIDLYNRMAEDYNVKALLTGTHQSLSSVGFNIEYINAQANFKYKYKTPRLHIGNHSLPCVFYNAIKRVKPNIVIAHESGINTLTAILLKKTFGYKLLVTCDNSPIMASSYGKMREWLRKFIVNHVDCMLIVHPDVKTLLETKYQKTKCRFVYLPIIQNDALLTKKIDGAQERALYYMQHYGMENKKVILFVGRLEDVKSPELLLQAYEQIKTNDTILIFVGNGSKSDSLQKYIKDKQLGNHVILTGALSGADLYAWYYLAHLFVLPSKFEPFGAVVNEALVAGCKVIVSDKVGASALITEQTGSVFHSGNIEELQSKMCGWLRDIPLTKPHISSEYSMFDLHYSSLQNLLD